MRWQVLQECFEKKDVAMLQEAVTKIPKEDAEYHIKRCIDSGLWVPGGGGADKADADDDDDNEDECASAAAAADGTAAGDSVYEPVDH